MKIDYAQEFREYVAEIEPALEEVGEVKTSSEVTTSVKTRVFSHLAALCCGVAVGALITKAAPSAAIMPGWTR